MEHLLPVPAYDLKKGDKVYINRLYHTIDTIKYSETSDDFILTFKDSKLTYIVEYGYELMTLVKEDECGTE